MEREVQMLEERLRQQMEIKTGFARTEKQEKALKDCFKKMDANGNQMLTFKEFDTAMKTLNFITRPAVMEAMFQKWDLDGSGYVDINEFCSGVFAKAPPPTHVVKPPNVRLATKVGLSPAGKFDEIARKLEQETTGLNEKKAWSSMDVNGNNVVSLAEVDKFINDKFQILGNKPALIRAFKRTCAGGNGDEYVQRAEFPGLVKNIVYYNQLYQCFDQVDSGDDRRIDIKEFLAGVKYLNMAMKPAEAEKEFYRMDTNSGGMILFDEFCEWFLQKKQV